METLGLTKIAKVLEECASSGAGTPNFVTPMQSHPSCSGQSDAEAASSVYYSTRIEGLSELRSKFDNIQLEFDIESSKSHRSELSADSDDNDVQVSDNAATADSDASDEQVPNSVMFERMKEHPFWGPLFRKKIPELEIGAKIGEGGQAEIFEALGGYVRNPLDYYTSDFYTSETEDGKTRLVVTVFKKEYSLVDMQRSWPPALASIPSPIFLESSGDILTHLCWVAGVHLMDDGRFAFILHRHFHDLRKLINKHVLKRNGCPPFDGSIARMYISSIASAMFNLHFVGILHNDLKVANVLVSHGKYATVTDFESSIGIVGTGFWRAREILRALKNRNLKPETFTHKSDVCSFAMTCYEIITSHMPFEDHDKWDYDIVLRGERPTLSNDPPYSMFMMIW